MTTIPRSCATRGYPRTGSSGLDGADAAALLDASAPELPLVARTQILRAAAGDPLALLELPTSSAATRIEQSWRGVHPTDRLERASAAHTDLPDATRLVLLVAALNDEDSLSEALEAGGVIARDEPGSRRGRAASESGIVDIDLQFVRFRHPAHALRRRPAARVGDRRRVHEALADVLQDQPDRRAWHRAALLTGEHEDVAVGLDRQERGHGSGARSLWR